MCTATELRLKTKVTTKYIKDFVNPIKKALRLFFFHFQANNKNEADWKINEGEVDETLGITFILPINQEQIQLI